MAKGTKRKKNENLTPAKNVDADILIPRLIFILSTLALLLFGFVMVFSASNVEAINNGQSPFYYLVRQILFGAVGIFLAVMIWRKVPFFWWRSDKLWYVFGFFAFLMLVTLVMGTDILGARRWIYIGPISIQPAEYAKIVLVLLVAKYISEYYNGKTSWGKSVLIAGGLTVLMLIFILIGQSDLGTTIICVVGVLAVLYISQIPTPWIVVLVIFCIFASIVVVVATGYRSNRMVFLDPYNDGAGGYGAGYQLIRSFYAFSEGGLAGVGLGNSYEKYQYLPEAETDFIFSIVGEELGFIGCIGVIILFVVFLVSGLMIAVKSKSRFAASIASSFVIMIVFQAFLNIMCVIGLAPTTGKPLPFISYGGSSLIASMVMVGFILSASEAEALPDEYARKRSGFKVSAPSFMDRLASSKVQNSAQVEESSTKKKVTVNQTKRSRVPGMPSATKGVKKIPKMKAPDFIDRNKQVKNSTKKKPKTTQRPSVKSSASASYAYRRNNSQPSFKPRVRKTSNSAKAVNTKNARPSVKGKTRKGR